MAWKRSPPRLIDAYLAALPDHPSVERRQMFGYPCAFVNRNMFSGLHQDRVIVRLPEKRRDEALARNDAKVFEPMKGRVMREYVALADASSAIPRDLKAWLAEAFAYTAGLPPKRTKGSSGRGAAKANSRARKAAG